MKLRDGEAIRAPVVVSAAGVLSTIRRMLPAEVTDTAWAQEANRERPASAHVCLYLGFKGDIRTAGASAAACGSDVWEWEGLRRLDISNPDALPDAPCLYCSFPSLKDPAHGGPIGVTQVG